MRPDVSIIPARERFAMAKRRALPQREVIALVIAQEMLCGCGCGVRLDPLGEGVIGEHVIARTIGGSEALGNRAFWRKPCAKAKTNGKGGDLSKGFKAKRQGGQKRKRKGRELRSNPTIPARANPWPKRRKVRT